MSSTNFRAWKHFLFAAAVFNIAQASAKSVEPSESVPTLEFATLSAFSAEPVEALLQGSSVAVDGGVQVLKLALVFATPLQISRVRVESCSDEFTDGAEFFYYPSYLRSFSEGGKTELVTDFPSKTSGKESLSRSMAIHFRLNQNVCMRSLKVFDRSGKAISLKTAQIARAKWIGTNSPAEIFDSRPETAIELEPKEIKIAFQEEKKISGLKVWNGDQFSPGFFSERKPLSGLMVSSDSMSPKEYKLNTEAGAHVIHFSETMTTKNLILKPIERGHLSEIRFLEPAGDFFPWFESALQMTARPQTSQTEKEALSVFNRELASIDDAESWSFRFRSDGSVFVSGRIDQEKTAGKFVVNGRFKILEKKDRSMKVQVFGVRRALGIPWDGHDCGTQCFVNVRKNEIKISDTLLIEKKNGSWFVRNRNPARNRGLPFTDLKVKISSLVE